MKEHPIYLSQREVQHIIEACWVSGKEARFQFRRPFHEQPPEDWFPHEAGLICKVVNGEVDVEKPIGLGISDIEGRGFVSPFGGAGDVLWGKEVFAVMGDEEKAAIDYQADYPWQTAEHYGYKLATSMPRWASRITLKVLSVTACRLHDMTTEDCIVEGFSTTLREHDAECHLREQAFEDWDSRFGAVSRLRSERNPWTWVAEAERMTQVGARGAKFWI